MYFFQIFLFLINYIYSQDPEVYTGTYNFIGEQRSQIDLQYDSIPGTNLYIYSPDNLTLFITDILPKKEFNINFKIYTNSTALIDKAKNGSLYVGIDFNTTRTENKRTDIILCNFTTGDTLCQDYLLYTDSNVFMPNPGTKNKLIPNGFLNYTSFLLFDNVKDYRAYFEVYLQKEYPVDFDNSTMFRFFFEDAQNLNWNVFLFYGLFDIPRIPAENIYVNYTATLVDGFGLASFYININMYLFISLIILLF
jgi:hypothetical protein